MHLCPMNKSIVHRGWPTIRTFPKIRKPLGLAPYRIEYPDSRIFWRISGSSFWIWMGEQCGADLNTVSRVSKLKAHPLFCISRAKQARRSLPHYNMKGPEYRCARGRKNDTDHHVVSPQPLHRNGQREVHSLTTCVTPECPESKQPCVHLAPSARN